MNKKVYVFLYVLLTVALSSFVSAATDFTINLSRVYDFDQDPATSDLIDQVGTIDSTADNVEGEIVGINGNGWDFDINNNSYVDMDGLLNKMGNFTLNCWVKFNSNRTTQDIYHAADPFETRIRYIATLGHFEFWLTTGLTHEANCPDGLGLNISNDKWYMITMRYDGSFMYGNVAAGNKCTSGGVTGHMAPTAESFGAISSLGGSFFNGTMDECYVWNYSMSDANLIELNNSGTGLFYPAFSAAPISAVNDPKFSSPTPPDGKINNTAFQVLNISHNGTDIGYFVYFDTTLFMDNVSANVSGSHLTFGYTFDEGNTTYSISVQNHTSGNFSNNITRSFFLDITSPELNDSFINHTMVFNRNLTGQFNFSDNLLLHRINFSVDGNEIFSKTNIGDNNFIYNLSYNASTLSIGSHNLSIEWADGHTTYDLKHEGWKIDRGLLFHDSLKFSFIEPYNNGYIDIKQKGINLFDSWDYELKKDRYEFKFQPNSKDSTYTFSIKSSFKIYVVDVASSKYEKWIIYDDHWMDFYPYTDITTKRINDYEIEITLNNVDSKIEELTFKSTGDLNVVTKEYVFYHVNMTEKFDTIVLNGFSVNMSMNVSFGELLFDISGLTPTGILEWNKTNSTVPFSSFDINKATFFKSFDLGSSPTGISAQINHTWYFNFSNFTQPPLKIEEQLQNQTPILVDLCGETTKYIIVNISYFDEISGNQLNVTNAYQAKIFDGTYYYNKTSSFVNNLSDQFCTNLNPGHITYNWDMWGPFTLSKNTYITRVVDIDPVAPIMISNNPPTNLSFFLIGTLNSSTVTYNWLTTQFQFIDGTMRIFRCNLDGSLSLVESIPIISGVVAANIQLLSQAYSYDVIINGKVFKDFTSYSKCHTESLTERTFFVDVNPIDISGIIGLNGIPCKINKTSNITATMTWEANPEDSSPVLGCIIAHRRSITGNVLVFNNCSTPPPYIKSVGIPINGNEYTVSASLNQSNNTRICGSVSFRPSDQASGIFGLSALLAVFFLIAGLSLIYAGDGQAMLTAGGVAIVASWILGILNLPWITVSSMIGILVMVGVVGRYTRKP